MDNLETTAVNTAITTESVASADTASAAVDASLNLTNESPAGVENTEQVSEGFVPNDKGDYVPRTRLNEINDKFKEIKSKYEKIAAVEELVNQYGPDVFKNWARLEDLMARNPQSINDVKKALALHFEEFRDEETSKLLQPQEELTPEEKKFNELNNKLKSMEQYIINENKKQVKEKYDTVFDSLAEKHGLTGDEYKTVSYYTLVDIIRNDPNWNMRFNEAQLQKSFSEHIKLLETIKANGVEKYLKDKKEKEMPIVNTGVRGTATPNMLDEKVRAESLADAIARAQQEETII